MLRRRGRGERGLCCLELREGQGACLLGDRWEGRKEDLRGDRLVRRVGGDPGAQGTRTWSLGPLLLGGEGGRARDLLEGGVCRHLGVPLWAVLLLADLLMADLLVFPWAVHLLGALLVFLGAGLPCRGAGRLLEDLPCLLRGEADRLGLLLGLLCLPGGVLLLAVLLSRGGVWAALQRHPGGHQRAGL